MPNKIECVQQFTFKRSKTDTFSQGYSISATVNTGLQVDIFSASASITSTFNQNWSNSVTTETTSQRTIEMKAGRVCFPPTVQLRMDCQQTLALRPGRNTADFEFWRVTANMAPNLVRVPDICKIWAPSFPVPLEPPSIIGDAVGKLCAATKPTNVTLYVTAPGGSPWSMEGCMRS